MRARERCYRTEREEEVLHIRYALLYIQARNFWRAGFFFLFLLRGEREAVCLGSSSSSSSFHSSFFLRLWNVDCFYLAVFSFSHRCFNIVSSYIHRRAKIRFNNIQKISSSARRASVPQWSSIYYILSLEIYTQQRLDFLIIFRVRCGERILSDDGPRGATEYGATVKDRSLYIYIYTRAIANARARARNDARDLRALRTTSPAAAAQLCKRSIEIP